MELLRGKVEYLNSITDDETEYDLDGAYGGWRLYLKGENHCIDKHITGRYPKKELYYLICAYIEGMWDSDKFTA